jgi:hypothetical protein
VVGRVFLKPDAPVLDKWISDKQSSLDTSSAEFKSGRKLLMILFLMNVVVCALIKFWAIGTLICCLY